MRYANMLKGKSAFVTGGSRGLGQAICIEFARLGCNVAFNYTKDDKGAAETQKEIEAHGATCYAFKASVTDYDLLHKAAFEIEDRIGPIDILVNNAGISQPLPIALLEEEDWDKVMDINIKGYYTVTRAILPSLIRQRKGVILNIGSLAGVRIIESPAHYSASKAAVKGFTESLCKELGRYGIRANCLAPGLLDEGVGSSLPESRVKKYVEHVALNRLGTPQEVAKFSAFLVSDRNTYMSGATILMDGGL